MIVGIDASNLRRGGGLTHLIEILRYASPEGFGISRVVVYGARRTNQLIEARQWLDLRHEQLLDRSLPLRLFWQRFVLPRRLKGDSVDVLFVPGASDGSGFHPFVTMSRNMLPFEWRELRRHGWTLSTLRYLLLRWAHAKSFRRADGVVFLTEYAKVVTLRYLGALAGSVTKIPHGVDERFLQAPRRQRSLSELSEAQPLRILYVSIVDPYKHQWHVVQAIARLRQEGMNVFLDLVGPTGNNASMRKLKHAIDAVDPNGKFVKYHGPVDYKLLHEIYFSADVFAYASSCENMPNILLESMAAGLPVACSNKGPMPEILGDAGIYFDPEDEADIANAVSQLYKSSSLRSELANAAYNRARSFSWRQCSDLTFSNIADVCRNSLRLGHPSRYKIRKVLRFVQIYGVTRTAFKVMGRLRISIALPMIGARERDIGIIGCGQFAFSTIGHSLWQKFGNRIAVAFDVDSVAQSQFESAYNVRISAKSFSDVLANPAVKIVYIASNHFSHAEYAVQSILSGRTTYIEKPIATTYSHLVRIQKALQLSPVKVFAGYNRPFSAAIRDLRSAVTVKRSEAMSLQCYIAAHSLSPSHWYRHPDEGTRICGNVGHWLDLAVHLFCWRQLPAKLNISLTFADESVADDDLVIGLSSDLGDLISIMITSRCEPFEGINETINFQHHKTIAKIDDFRSMTLWQGARLTKRKYWPKDVGHKAAILQPFDVVKTREWKEIVMTTLLMLHITEMVRKLERTSVFSFASSYEKLESDVAAFDLSCSGNIVKE